MDERLSIDSKNTALDDLRLDASVAFYEQAVAERTKGPQLEGFSSEYLREALRDPLTKKIDLGNGVDWPLFSPVKHNQDYRAAFFDNHFPDQPAYYLSLPPSQEDLNTEDLKNSIETLRSEHAIIVYDFLNEVAADQEPHFIFFEALKTSIHDVTPESQAFGMDYGKPRVSHFIATAKKESGWSSGDHNTTAAFARLVIKGDYQPVPDHGPTVLTRGILMENDGRLLDDIWKIYSQQFEELVEDHPSLQIQPREELERMLLDEESFNIAYMDQGKVAALCYFVGNIEKCVWLNAAFYEEIKDHTPGLKLAYFPGIVVDKERARQGMGYVDEMIKLIERTYQEAGMLGMQIVFQCTNVSETYIPKIVTSVISNNGVFKFDQAPDESGSSFRKIAQYDYRIFELNDE